MLGLALSTCFCAPPERKLRFCPPPPDGAATPAAAPRHSWWAKKRQPFLVQVPPPETVKIRVLPLAAATTTDGLQPLLASKAASATPAAA